jgi:hypothetical protein
MDDPEIGRQYRLVRRDGGNLQIASFIRFEDGSGIVVADGQHIGFELDQTAWHRHWTKLRELGYIDIDDALLRNLITSDELSAKQATCS